MSSSEDAGGTCDSAVPAQIHAHDAIVAAEAGHPGVEALGMADGGMQQQQGVGLAPGIGIVVDVIGELDAVAGGEFVCRHAILPLSVAKRWQWQNALSNRSLS